MENKRKGEFESIKDVLEHLIHDTNLEKGLDEIAIDDAWLAVMGKGVYTYTKEIVFKNGQLTVRLSSSVLREELSYGKEKIINLMNEKLQKPLINRIKLL